MKTNKEILNEFYSTLCNLYHNLQDDLTLDLDKGEHGYKSYERSYGAIKKNTFRQLKRKINKIKKDLDALGGNQE